MLPSCHGALCDADQPRQLQHAAEQNAEDLTADARALLDAGRFPRAYALAVLALEELGKAQLCHDVLTGDLDKKRFRREWSIHVPKLDRIGFLTTLAAKTVERIFAAGEDDHTMKLRGLVCRTDPGPARRAAADSV